MRLRQTGRSVSGCSASAGGDSPALITKESASEFQLYASGRRFCQSLRATLNLVRRQDLASRLLQLLTPGDDELLVEVEMNEAAMPAVVLLVATPKQARQLLKEDSEHPGRALMSALGSGHGGQSLVQVACEGPSCCRAPPCSLPARDTRS